PFFNYWKLKNAYAPHSLEDPRSLAIQFSNAVSNYDSVDEAGVWDSS
ncbi:unnamed protein product, partial [marine sediment metagenome]